MGGGGTTAMLRAAPNEKAGARILLRHGRYSLLLGGAPEHVEVAGVFLISLLRPLSLLVGDPGAMASWRTRSAVDVAKLVEIVKP